MSSSSRSQSTEKCDAGSIDSELGSVDCVHTRNVVCIFTPLCQHVCFVLLTLTVFVFDSRST